MRFTWDERKRRTNLRDHGFDFADAKRVFGAYEKAQLLRLDGVTYIQHLNAHDRAKALTIYKKQKGVDLRGSYLDDMCRFERQ